jgi:hypothetical protein
MPTISKRGICVPWNFSSNDFKLYEPAIDGGRLSWLGNWEMWKPKGIPQKLIYIPQCRTGTEATQIVDYMHGYRRDDQVHGFLGFNEPDIATQANLTVDRAANLWKKHVLPLKAEFPDLKIGSPSVSNGPEGLPWLHSFIESLGGIEKSGIDHICLHHYSPTVQEFKKYVATAHDAFKLPVWVTEFACTRWDPFNQCTEQEVSSFMKDAMSFLDQAHYVQRYAWFGAMSDVGDAVGQANGLQKDGKLSAAGLIYCS